MVVVYSNVIMENKIRVFILKIISEISNVVFGIKAKVLLSKVGELTISVFLKIDITIFSVDFRKMEALTFIKTSWVENLIKDIMNEHVFNVNFYSDDGDNVIHNEIN